MTTRLLVFTNLYPSAALPTHGLFVRERVCRVAEATGFELHVVCPVPAVPRGLRRDVHKLFAGMPQREDVDGVPVHHPRYFHLPGVSERFQARRMMRGARDVVRTLVAPNRCVIDAHYVYPDGTAALALAGELDVPCFVTARGTDLNVLAERPAIARQIRDSSATAAGLFAVSEPLRAKYRDVTGLADERVELVRNGVDFDRFRPGEPEAARAALGLPIAAALCCSVGRLVPVKGLQVMARAMRHLPEAVHWVVVGAGPERERLLEIAPPGRVHFLGAKPPDVVAEVYRACDLLVLPSENEGWPNVVTEALASGIPVVASAVGGIPDILTSPRAGSLVRVGDARVLAKEIERFLEMPRDPAAIRGFAQRFGWDEPIQTIADRFRATGVANSAG